MREIKFRYIIDTAPGISIKYRSLKEIEKGVMNWISLKNQLWKVIARDEYINLKDRNGKEIYEGDVFIINKDDDEWYDKVIWNELEAKFELSKYKCAVTGIPLLYVITDNGCEIIGNIHENPKLLGMKK